MNFRRMTTPMLFLIGCLLIVAWQQAGQMTISALWAVSDYFYDGKVVSLIPYAAGYVVLAVLFLLVGIFAKKSEIKSPNSTLSAFVWGSAISLTFCSLLGFSIWATESLCPKTDGDWLVTSLTVAGFGLPLIPLEILLRKFGLKEK